MNKKHKLTFSLILTLMVLVFAIPNFAQKSSVDNKRMTRDLRIMEGILDKLLKGKSSRRYISGDTKALYLQGFGIIFHTKQDAFREPRIIISGVYRDQLKHLRAELERIKQHQEKTHQLMEEIDKQAEVLENIDGVNLLSSARDDFEIESEFADEDREKILEKEQKAIESLKENIHIFFQNYTSAIGQLRPKDRIAIVVNLENWELTDMENAFLTAWVIKRDVDRYRRQELSSSDFRSLIHFQLSDSETSLDTDISVMTEILDRAMDTSTSWARASNNGIYLEGLGALFFIDLPGIYWSGAAHEDAVVIIRNNIENAISYTYGYNDGEKKKQEGKTKTDYIQEIQDDLFDLMASYGHTLRLKPQERIIFNVNLGHRFGFLKSSAKTPSDLILHLMKKDVDEYNKGILPLSNLRKKMFYQAF